ncbi:fused response regulator/phosphatase [Paracoccus aestuarii]|uniref:Fused response regulator/phosphatase n=1 Tax=Paracoccus aestuarii TaxID=453842 RepID=A0A419A0S4_9RHOB|nr:SpoIIE family protein phosphatase [Paracoccus aestuarii]RJL06526.1 fused response regulator/phosphatase [Paracoccus aestuarii]WCQ98831.1 SpoIIE family protein phosphatase [Paracoccus aestuarii]
MTAANRPSAKVTLPTPPTARLVLLVDDSAAQRRLLARLLTRGGYQVAEAATGDEALAICARLAPDLVLSDWNMPGMTGLEFCAAFRAMSRPNYGYFILLTSNPDARAITEGLQAGADDFLHKPVAPQELLARIAAGERILRVEEELRASNTQLRAALAQLSETQAAIERDLREARKLQQGLVRERSGRFGQFELSLLLRPAGHIGGDLVGFFPICPERVGLYALDVSGHGVTAALLTAQLSVHLSGSSDQNIALRGAQAGSDSVGPAALAHFFNNMMLEEMNTDTYFTMIYAELNHVSGRLRMVQAGHPHPALQRADGQVQHLGQGGMPVGVFEHPLFDEIDITLDPGDRLLIASDGITEAATPNGRQLGNDGLEAVMRTNAFLQGHSFLESMAWSVSEYCRGERQDDMSAILIEHRGTGKVIRLDD